jgi:hypothetical protein
MQIRFLAGLSFRSDLNLFIWQPRGILDEPHVEQIIATLEEAEDNADHPFDRYTDLSKLDAVELSSDYVLRVSLYRRALYLNRRPVKSAMYVVNPETAEVALTHSKFTMESSLQVRVFSHKGAAARWLGVSAADLEVDR